MKTRISDLVSATNLTPEDKNFLEDHARYLLSLLPEDYTTPFVDAELPGKKIQVTELRRIAKVIKDSRVVDTHPILAMVAAVAGNNIAERRWHESLKAWVLVASLAPTGHKWPVKHACRRTRRLAEPSDRWLFEKLLNVKPDLVSIVGLLQSLRREYSGPSDEDKTKERMVAGLHVLLADLLYKRDKRAPGQGGRGQIGVPPYQERLIEVAADEAVFPDLDGVKVISDRQQVTGAGSGAECSSAGDRYLDTIANDAYPTFLKRRVRMGRELARTFGMRATASACAWEGLSKNEVQRTLACCFDAAMDGCRPSLWIVLALLLGRTPERLWSTKRQVFRQTSSRGEYWRVTKKRVQLVSYLSLPEFDLEFRDRQLVEPVYNCLLLSVPKSLTQPLRTSLEAVWSNAVSNEELRAELRDRIAQLNTDHNTRLTKNRLAAFLHRSLIQAGECDVVSKRIRGISAQANYKQRYEAVNQERTQAVYRRYATGLLAEINKTDEWQESQFKSEPLGSHIKFRDDAVRLVFEYWRDEADPDRQPSDDVIDYHNRYVMYVYQLLMLASGHRPVRVPLETLRSYDPVSHELFICDKVKNRASDSRTVVLPETACQQISCYLDHLHALETRCQRVAPALCRTIRRAIAGDGPLLFRLEKVKDMGLGAVPFDPTAVLRWLKDDWDFPLQWHRHWLRSSLTRRDQPHEYIDQFMGHEDDQPASLGRYSNLTYSGRRSLAACIDSMLADVDISAIGGLS